MARKSNKTAHVLNLLATGHDSKKENTEEGDVLESVETPDTASDSAQAAKDAAPASKTAEAPEVTAPPAPQTVSVIDTTENDPVAELIHQKLLEELNLNEESEPEPIHIPEPETEPEPEPIYIPEPELSTEPELEMETIQIPEPELSSETEPETEAIHIPEPETEPEPEIIRIPEPEPIAEPEPIVDPEPDFVSVNVMERIVQDKAIYFMRQFEVCTCDRCIADTVAIALNGLPSKYMVTAPAAVEPLISYYTNKFISTITVELTKACMIVKENPRH